MAEIRAKRVERFIRAVRVIAAKGCEFEGEEACEAYLGPRAVKRVCGPCLAKRALRRLERGR